MEDQTTQNPIQISDPLPIPVSSPSPKTPIIPSLLVLLVILLGSTAFLYYQNQQLKSMLASYQTPVASPTPTVTPDLMADWKTYTNTKYGFSIKYPEKYTGGEGTVYENVAVFRISQPPDSSLLGIRYQKTTVELVQWWKGLLGNETSQKFAAFDTDTNFNSTPAIEISFDKKGEFELSDNRVILFKHNGINFEIKINHGNPHTSEQNQILSTFKFLDPGLNPEPVPSPTATPKPSAIPIPESTPIYY